MWLSPIVLKKKKKKKKKKRKGVCVCVQFFHKSQLTARAEIEIDWYQWDNDKWRDFLGREMKKKKKEKKEKKKEEFVLEFLFF